MLSKSDLEEIDSIFSKRIKSELKPVKEDMSQIRKDLKTVINFFDNEYLEIRKRVERLEQHLNLPPLN
jgi:hypothetical protein